MNRAPEATGRAERPRDSILTTAILAPGDVRAPFFVSFWELHEWLHPGSLARKGLINE
jgi:hypothetical protein